MDVLAAAVSPYNYVRPVTRLFRLADGIILNDTSITEGERAAEAWVKPEVRLAIVKSLAGIGVLQIQCGRPGRSARDRELIRGVRQEGVTIGLEAIIFLGSGKWREEIDSALDCGADILDLQYPISDIHLVEVERQDRMGMRNLSVEAVRYAQGRGSLVKFSGTDTLRADLDFVKGVYEAVLEAGASRLSITDTTGSAMPAAVRYFVGEIVDSFAVPVQVHFHNDFGLALANTLAALEVGAQVVDVSLNGLGDRAGNASLDEVVVAARALYGIDLGISLDQLRPISESFARQTGVPLHPLKPLCGDRAFAHHPDSDRRGVLDCPHAFECIPPETVGNTRRIKYPS